MNDPWLVTVNADLQAPTAPPSGPLWNQILKTWRQHVGPEGTGGDREDFVEAACRLDAAITVLGDRAQIDLLHDTRPEQHDWPRWGPQPRTTRHEHGLAADRYAHLRTFHANAGRLVRLVGHDDTGQDSSLVTAVLDLHRAGSRRLIVKVVSIPKYGRWDLELPDHLNRHQAYHLLMQHLDGALVHLEGDPHAFLVQQHVAMRHEYRLFVIDHQLVSGGGCVEYLTPLDNDGDPFDTQTEAVRGSGLTQRSWHTVSALLRFGQDVADQVRDERPDLDTYTLDVAHGLTGPLIVEFNSLLNSGLYASDPWTVLRALDAQHTRLRALSTRRCVPS